VARDSSSILIPDVKNGSISAANYVLRNLDIKTEGETDAQSFGNALWGSAKRGRNSVRITKNDVTPANHVPDVVGMGARDAVYKLEKHGLKVKIVGCGKVKKQSIAPSTKVKKGMCVTIELG
jgi:cell division protein FtsI (penicillin-binding protein 3)